VVFQILLERDVGLPLCLPSEQDRREVDTLWADGVDVVRVGIRAGGVDDALAVLVLLG
jgi:hypothetical protein